MYCLLPKLCTTVQGSDRKSFSVLYNSVSGVLVKSVVLLRTGSGNWPVCVLFVLQEFCSLLKSWCKSKQDTAVSLFLRLGED